jgi:predicted Zn-dependent peptidase
MIPSRAAVFAAALALVSTAQANPHEFSLANGLRLIVKEDHRAPTMVHQVWYRMGTMDEAPGATGVAHVLEHMMFKGTRRHGPGPFLAGLQTRRDQAREALELARTVIAEFVARGPTEAELAAAKKNLVGGFSLRIDTNRKVLEQLALIGFYELPLDWLDEYPARVQGVTLAQIRSAFARRVDPAKLSIVVVGAPD